MEKIRKNIINLSLCIVLYLTLPFSGCAFIDNKVLSESSNLIEKGKYKEAREILYSDKSINNECLSDGRPYSNPNTSSDCSKVYLNLALAVAHEGDYTSAGGYLSKAGRVARGREEIYEIY